MLYSPSNYKNSNNTMVKLIRKRNFAKPQKSWWVRGPYEDNYYSSYLDNKHYIYSFKNNEAATKCTKFLNEYKFRYNKYPDLVDENYISSDMNNSTNNDDINDIYIDMDILSSIKYRCIVNNIGLLCIEHFDYQFIKSSFGLGKGKFYNLDISGIDMMEDEELDLERQIRHYDDLLNL